MLLRTIQDVSGGAPSYRYSYTWYVQEPNSSYRIFAQVQESEETSDSQTLPVGESGNVYALVTDM